MANLKFNKTHEWILVNGTTGKIGISEHAQKQLGDIVFVELPNVGDKVKCGQSFMNIESVKAVSELYSPCCGKITKVNDQLEVNPEMINEDAANTWIVEVEIEKLSDSVFTEDEYNNIVK